MTDQITPLSETYTKDSFEADRAALAPGSVAPSTSAADFAQAGQSEVDFLRQERSSESVLKEPAVGYARSTKIPTFFGQPMLQGAFTSVTSGKPDNPQLCYSHPRGEIWVGDALGYVESSQPTRIVSPSHPNYIFFQYGQDHGHKITRPLNSDLLLEEAAVFRGAFDRFAAFLGDLRKTGSGDALGEIHADYLGSNEINRIVYTLQQSIGCIGDSFDSPNHGHG